MVFVVLLYNLADEAHTPELPGKPIQANLDQDFDELRDPLGYFT